MLTSKNIVFIIGILAVVLFITPESWHSLIADTDNQVVIVENDIHDTEDNSSDDKPLYIKTNFLSLGTILLCTKLNQPINHVVIDLRYPVWLPPKIS